MKIGEWESRDNVIIIICLLFAKVKRQKNCFCPHTDLWGDDTYVTWRVYAAVSHLFVYGLYGSTP